ncbi:hypothetical protein MCOR19_002144 [Pyricularia oryzae]|nr:hypothetical protein MCOR19_002144 [Pyricularia oryzae]KAI6386225.1 hypothetical protein MCOR32_001099 [Pyricularia oryzae]KAI6495453.1 hypothetical protein MCOR18_000927 [Pyricularia oryzae]
MLLRTLPVCRFRPGRRQLPSASWQWLQYTRPAESSRLPQAAAILLRTDFGSRFYSSPASSYYDAKVEDIRNIGIIAHVDAGKTTTTERMLFHSGVTKHLGNVDSGDTVTDFLPMERDRGITIQSAAITFQWPLPSDCSPGNPPKTINLIDTPGHQDFRFEVDRCMPVIDGAVCIMDGVKGVEAHTERVWQSAQQFRIPRIMYVNKLDRDGASFKRSVSEIASRLNAWPLVCQIPWWEKDVFVGVVDVITRTGIRWKSGGTKASYNTENLKKLLAETNPDLLTQLDEAHLALVDILCEHDERLLEGDLENITPEVMKRTIRELISDGSGKLVPVFAGSSLRNIGIDPLLDAVVDYLPNANERPPVEVSLDGVRSDLENVIDASTKAQPVGKKKQFGNKKGTVTAVASVFKVAADFNRNDMSRGMLSFVRVYHGTLPADAEVWNSNRHKRERALSMLQISANKTQLIPHLSTGQIGALKGLKDAKTGDTLILVNGGFRSASEGPMARVQIRPAEIPNPVAFITMAPAARGNIKDLEAALERLSREDPSLRYSYNERDEVFILSGMGKLHLEVLLDRLKNVYRVEATIFGIEVEYKECLLESLAPNRFVFDQTVGGKAGKAACTVTLQPLPDQEDKKSTRAISKDMVRADENNLIEIKIKKNDYGTFPEGFDYERTRHELLNGASAALRMGPRLRRPVHGTLVTIDYNPSTDYFGPNTPPSHNVKAAYNAVKTILKDAQSKSQVGILEPVMKVSIVCPEGAAEAVQKDIGGARGGVVYAVVDRNEKYDEASGGVDPADRINLDDVYVPRDPYDTIQSLRDPKKGLVRQLEIKARIPFAEMLNYDQLLRGKTGGRHSLDMELDTFERVVGPREKAIG